MIVGWAILEISSSKNQVPPFPPPPKMRLSGPVLSGVCFLFNPSVLMMLVPRMYLEKAAHLVFGLIATVDLSNIAVLCFHSLTPFSKLQLSLLKDTLS